MTGNVSIDLSLENIWTVWREFRKGKKFADENERNLNRIKKRMNLSNFASYHALTDYGGG